jgi:hypothetical protein
MAGIDLDAGAEVVAIPMLLLGGGIGALASQLGSVTVSAVPVERSSEVGGIQNTATNLGASIGTAVAGSILIAVLTASFIAGIQQNPDVPQQVKERAGLELTAGIPFISNSALEQAMREADQPETVTAAVLEANTVARVKGLKSALGVLAVIAIAGLFLTGSIPPRPPGEGGAESG